MGEAFRKWLSAVGLTVLMLDAAGQSTIFRAYDVVVKYCPDVYIGCGHETRWGYSVVLPGEGISGSAATFAGALAKALLAQRDWQAYVNAIHLPNSTGTPRIGTVSIATNLQECANRLEDCARIPAEIISSSFSPQANAPAPKCRQEHYYAGNPIQVATGNKVQEEAILRGAEGELSQFSLRYGSALTGSAFFGPSWLSTFSARILAPSLSSARIENGAITVLAAISDEGRITTFKKLPEGSWEANRSGLALRYANGRITVLDYDAGRVDVFASDGGQLVARFTLTGRSVSLNPDGRIVRATFDSGRALNFEFSDNSLVSSVSDFSGALTKFEYGTGEWPLLSEIKFPDGSSRRFFYAVRPGFSALLEGLQDESTRLTSTWAYDDSGRAITSTRGNGPSRTSINYGNPYSPQVENPNGQMSEHSYSLFQGRALLVRKSQPAGAGCNASSIRRQYDARGNLISHDDFSGRRSCYYFDSANREVGALSGLVPTDSCDAPLASVATLRISREWHPKWKLVTHQAEPHRRIISVYNGEWDPLTRATLRCAPEDSSLPSGDPIAVLCKQVEQATTDPTGSLGFNAPLQAGVPARVSTWTYNRHGQVLSAKGPRTDINDTTT